MRKLLLIILGLIALAAAISTLRPSKEPAYASKPLSYWLSQLGPEPNRSPYSWLELKKEKPATENVREAESAIASMGTQIIPVLLDKVRREHGLRDRAYALIWPGLPVSVQKHLAPPKQFCNYGMPHGQIVWALETLSTNAVPALIAELRHPNSQVQITAMAALCASGANADAAIPSLVTLARHPNGFVRRWAIFALGQMGPARTNALPTLMAALHDNDRSPLPGSSARVRETAADVLGHLGAEAAGATPELKKLLTDPDRGVREEAAVALWRISRDREVLPILVDCLRRGEDQRRIIWTLAEMGPTALPAVPAIEESLGPREFRAINIRAKAHDGPLPADWPAGATLEDVASEALHRIDPGLTNELADMSFLNVSSLKLGGMGGGYAFVGGSRPLNNELGLESAPALVQVMLRDAFPANRMDAMLKLQEVGFKPTPDLVPLLIRHLDDRSVFRYRGWHDQEIGREFVCPGDLAAEMLGEIGQEAQPALPKLRELLTDDYWGARPFVPTALWRIGADTNVLACVIRNLESPQNAAAFRRFLTLAGEMGAAAKPACEAIKRGMTNYPNLADPVQRALEKIDPGAKGAIKVRDHPCGTG